LYTLWLLGLLGEPHFITNSKNRTIFIPANVSWREMVWGLFKKFVIADQCALYANAILISITRIRKYFDCRLAVLRLKFMATGSFQMANEHHLE
jgi:hypothetical protein